MKGCEVQGHSLMAYLRMSTTIFGSMVDKAKHLWQHPRMEDSRIIDALGGTDKVAALCALHKSAISQWRKRGIPRAWRLYLKKLRPSLFKDKRKSDS